MQEPGTTTTGQIGATQMRILLNASVFILFFLTVQLNAQVEDLYDLTRVRTLSLSFKQVDWWQQLLNNKEKKIDIPADLTVDGKLYKDIGVRFKGNSSYRSTGTSLKKPFNLSIDAFNETQRLYGYKTLNLNNCFLDPTFVREVISYELIRPYLPAPRANFIKLVINNESWGIYVNVQQPNKEFLDEGFGENDGNNFKGDPSGMDPGRSAFQWLGSNPESYKANYELKSGDENTAWTHLVTMIDKLNNTPTQNLPQELLKVLDVDRALWYLAICNVFANLDSYLGSGHNFYTYQDENAGLFHMIPWDLNETFGVFNLGMSIQQLQQLAPDYQQQNSDRPLMARLCSNSTWRHQYRAHIKTILTESFNWSTISPLVTKYQNLIRSEVLADSKKLYSNTLFSQAVTQDVRLSTGGPGGRWMPGLKPFIEARTAFLLNHPDINRPVPTITRVSHSPAEPNETHTVWIKATITSPGSVTLAEVVHSSGTAGLYDDGQHHDGAANDSVFGGSIPPASIGTTVRYYIRSEATGGGMAVDPPRAAHDRYSYTIKPGTGVSAVEIHEFVAKNDTGIKDEKGEYEDWIEMLNTGTAPVTLTGYTLTDKMDNPTKWPFPDNTTIQPGETILVWADEDQGDGPLHANFKLSAGGESIHFFDKDGKTLLDTVTFGAQQADVSSGRIVGYPAVWATFPVPTPRAANQPEPCGHLEYDGLDITKTPVKLFGQGTPSVGGTASYKIENAPASTFGFFVFSLAPFSADMGNLGSMLVNPSTMLLVPVTTSSTGTAAPAMSIPGESVLAGMSFYFQSFVYAGNSGGFSGGVITRICR